MKFNNKSIEIGCNVTLGKNVRIGDNVTIYDNVIIADNTTICNDCILGEPLNGFYSNLDYQNPATVIGAGSLIRSHCILYAGSTFGENFVTGHRVTIRENAIFGRNCQVGTLSDIQGNSRFGSYVKMHSNVHIGEFSTVGNCVFIYPYTVFTNDALPPSNVYLGPTIGDFSIITVHCVVLPGILIGENCLVGANSVVNKNLPDFSFALGSPAKALRDIREIKNADGGNQYPWMTHFERGMPWQGIGYDKWREKGGFE